MVPAQKSNSSSISGTKITKFAKKNITKITIRLDFFWDNANSSLTNVITGCNIPMDEVSPAIKSRKNHMNPIVPPNGNPSKIAGIAINPIVKAPDWAIRTAPATPRKATAAGITIDPPNTTSISSFNDAEVSPLRAISSSFLIKEAYVTIAPKPKLNVKKTCPAAAIQTLGFVKDEKSGDHKKSKTLIFVRS